MVLSRVHGRQGELVLRRVDGHFEIISNGVFLMDTRNGESERVLVGAAVDAVKADGVRLLIGGLGVGFSLAEAVSNPRVGEVTVVECEPSVIAWHGSHLSDFSAGAVGDREVTVVCADLLAWLRQAPDDLFFDVMCLDIDNGPDWTVTPANAALYGESGLELLVSRLAPGGAVAFWSAAASEVFAERLASRFASVRTVEVSVPRGPADVVYVACAS
ncbi:spermidine synthase [Phytomonospora sp. NPDC050363]|uniref:spermine/spermidine synthase domain-containing protein n=1 Tax=Phytomonospora sp. NPDC050363 TaxID=3155642 RepID=UPI0033FA7E7E